ncbi:MAG: hypothetical protein Q8910_06575 [Bacteroidota bacterium]|nr:hypothetical protein [Bacteroidota bacterium]
MHDMGCYMTAFWQVVEQHRLNRLARAILRSRCTLLPTADLDELATRAELLASAPALVDFGVEALMARPADPPLELLAPEETDHALRLAAAELPVVDVMPCEMISVMAVEAQSPLVRHLEHPQSIHLVGTLLLCRYLHFIYIEKEEQR